MALVMGGTMGLVMLAWMLNMYRNTKANIAIITVSLLLMGLGTFLDRSQATVGDVEFMRAMIPHHSLAITRSERFNVDDVCVCELAVSISMKRPGFGRGSEPTERWGSCQHRGSTRTSCVNVPSGSLTKPVSRNRACR